MAVFKIFQMFLLPSVFILILLILGLTLFLLRKKIGKILIIVGIIFYYFFSIAPVADSLISPLEDQYKFSESNLENTDTIVLLSGGVKNENLPENSQLAESTLFRSIGAIQIYLKQSKKPIIIISGTDPISPEKKDSFLIAKFIQSFNIPKEDIILEQISKNTYQSAVEVKKLVGNKPFILVTSATHLPRAVYIYKKMGLNPIPVPADFKAEVRYNLIDFFPDPKNLKKSNIAFHEYFGILYYRIIPIYE
jgi:uncharacterized SAM-binding protein YcdF (DUF218 family)